MRLVWACLLCIHFSTHAFAELPERDPAEAALTEEEKKILDRGEIPTSRYVVGGVIASTPFGFGIGHAVQGRYGQKGWIFTVGEVASLAVALSARCGDDGDNGDSDRDWWDDEDWDHVRVGGTTSLRGSNSCNEGLLFLGVTSFIGFKVWEIIDAWVVPPSHNRRYRELKSRSGSEQASLKWSAGLIPQRDGARLGLNLSF